MLVEGALSSVTSLVGGSISIPYNHFDEVNKLFSLIEKNVSKPLGITTYSVQDEAYKVLSGAVEKNVNRSNANRASLFETISVAQDVCDDKLRELIKLLDSKPVDREEASRVFSAVYSMYEELKRDAEIFNSEERLNIYPVPRCLRRGEIERIYQKQGHHVSLQLIHMLQKPVEDSDKAILSEAIVLYRHETNVGKLNFYFASLDHHFIPYHREGIRSGQITDKINNKFSIIVECPDSIVELVRPQLK